MVFIVGSRLKELRKEKRITQKALGAILGVRETTISLYETDVNDPSDSIKVMIANHFGVSLDYLLGVIEEQVTPYSKDKYIMLTQEIDDEERSLLLRLLEINLNSDEKLLLSQFVEFILFRRGDIEKNEG